MMLFVTLLANDWMLCVWLDVNSVWVFYLVSVFVGSVVLFAIFQICYKTVTPKTGKCVRMCSGIAVLLGFISIKIPYSIRLCWLCTR